MRLHHRNVSIGVLSPFGSQECRKIGKHESINFFKKMPAEAVYGIVQMEVNKYLVSVKDTILIGQILHHKIYQLAKVEFICANEWEDEKDRAYVEGLREILESKCFYFSDSYDLTNSFQTFVDSGCSMKGRRKEYMYN